MKIALDATYSVGAHLSGVGIYCREILTGLPAAHPDARFFFCYRPHRFLRSFRQSLPPDCRRRLLWETRALHSADLFHGLNQRLPAGRLPRAVTTFHDLFVLTGDYSTGDFRRRFAQQARLAAERSDLIIAVSRFTAVQVRELLSVEEARLRVIPHGVRLPAAVVPHAERDRMILHVGAIQKRKNVQRLVSAFERLAPGWRLVLAGSLGFGGERILSFIRSSPRSADIDVLGYVSGEQLAALYARAAVLAFPSLDEGFGMPVLEAMAHGLPVVTSSRSALPEAAGDAALLVDPENVEELAVALRQLTEDQALRGQLVRRGLVRATCFGWDQAVARTWAVYRELAG